MKWSSIAAARRILDREQGAIAKDWGGRLPIALIYPNAYYVGMSSLALQSLYARLNARPDVVCERVFCGYRRPGDRPTAVSLETQRALAEFAVVAATFSFELDYLHFVTLLHRAGIPPLSSARDESYPVLLAGGPAVSANPEPLADLCDAFFIGEVEEMLPRLLDTLRDGIAGNRQDLLQELAEIPGVYVPSRHPDCLVERQWVRNLDLYPTHTSVYTTATEFGDMHLIEIARGCGRGCRFCLAGCLYRPPRESSPARLLELARAGQQYRSKVGLVSPAVSDYSRIDELVAGLRGMEMLISVSSLRVDPLPEALLSALAASGTRTLTIAPEAGSERLRTLIRKDVQHDDIIRAARQASAYRFPELKLYFMIGLPGEEEEDIEAITDLVQAMTRLFGGRVLVSIAPFVPKAHTPFERMAMAPVPVLRDRLRRLQRALGNLGTRVTSDSMAWATVQAILARGDRQLSKVLASLTSPSLAAWRGALHIHGLQAERYTRAYPANEALPWSFIRVSPSASQENAT